VLVVLPFQKQQLDCCSKRKVWRHSGHATTYKAAANQRFCTMLGIPEARIAAGAVKSLAMLVLQTAVLMQVLAVS